MHNEIDELLEIIEEVKLFLPRLEKAFESVSELFYENMTTQTWEIFSQVFTGIDDLYQTLKSVNNGLMDSGIHYGIQTVIDEAFKQMEKKISLLTAHISRNRHVAVGEVIKYEFIPLVNELSISLGESKLDMATRFASNLELLRRSSPKAASRMEQLKRDEVRYPIIPAKNGMPNLYVPDETGELVSIYSPYDPAYEVDKWVEATLSKLAGNKRVLVYGFGLGQHLLRLSQRIQNISVYIVEPDEQVLLAAMHTIELEVLFNQIEVEKIIIGIEKRTLDDELKDFFMVNDTKINSIEIPVYNELYYNEKIKLKDCIHQAAWSYLSNINTMNVLGLRHAKNILYNIAANLSTPSVTHLHESLSGISAVIVGAGPSLEKDIELLRKIKDYAIIIAAGSSIQSLQHYGIDPHLVVSMDGGDSNYVVFKDINRPSFPLVYNPQIDYRIMDLHNKHAMHLFFTSDSITSHFMDTVHDFHSNFSVTGTAIQLAAYLGCKEIIFTGQDLSYSADHLYASGAKHVTDVKQQAVVEQATEFVENVQGGRNKTDMKMQITLANIEKEIEDTAHVHFVNASRLGAKIDHTQYEPMESVLERLSQQPQVGAIIEHTLSCQGNQYDSSSKVKVVARLEEMSIWLEEVGFVVKKVKKQLNTLLPLSRSNPDKCLKVMASIEDQWGTIITSKPFEVLYVYVLGADVHIFDRNVPELAAEKNIQKKANLFVKVLGALIDRIEDTNVHLVEYVAEAVTRLDKLEINNGI